MTTDYATRDSEEAKTHELFGEYIKSAEWCYADPAIGQVFKAKWIAALSLDEIYALGNLLSGFNLEKDHYKAGLRRLVRAKVLRSRLIAGKRCWEVNY